MLVAAAVVRREGSNHEIEDAALLSTGRSMGRHASDSRTHG